MDRNTISLQERIKNAAQILKVEESDIKHALSEGLDINIDDEDALMLLDAASTDEGMVQEALVSNIDEDLKFVRLRAAVYWLKGRDPFEKPQEGSLTVSLPDDSQTSSLYATVTKVIDATKPIAQHKDRELLERYIAERDYEMEQELHKRSKGQPFIVLTDSGKHEPGKEPIDVDASMDLLKRARKGYVNSTIVPYGDVVANVYRITELNLEDRRVELCPVCGASLYKGYCTPCELNWSPADKDTRAYARLVSEHSGRFQRESYADRKALHASAMKGIVDLRKTWPSMSKLFDDRKESGDLPKVIQISDRPTVSVADPFNAAGNRSF